MQSSTIRQVLVAGLLTVAAAQHPLLAASGTKVALVSGGPHPYYVVWAQAGKDAARDFKLDKADYKIPPKWELGEQTALLEALAQQGYNSYVIAAFNSKEAAETILDLTANGATVVGAAGCIQDPSKAQFCLATDAGNSAYQGAKMLIKQLAGKKRIAHFTGWLADPNTQPRINAVQRAAKESGAEIVQVISDIDAPEPAAEAIGAYLAAHAKDIDGIVTTAWTPSVEAAIQLRRLGDKRIKMVGIDHDEVVRKAIKDGFVAGTMLQNPYGQAYIGAFALDRLRHGCQIKANAPWNSNASVKHFIDSGSVYVDASDVDQYVGAMQRITKTLLSNFESTYFDCKR